MSNIFISLIYFCGINLLCSQYSLISAIKFGVPQLEKERDTKYWYEQGKAEIEYAVHRRQITSLAKNVIIFLGDGMGITVNTASRIFKGQRQMKFSGEEHSLVWDKFPAIALAKTYNLDKQVSDSAGTATAYLAGVKANFETVGVNGAVKAGNCKAAQDTATHVKSILEWSQQAGKDTGFVTTTRITHATPAALYAHSAHRNWECDAKLKNSEFDTSGCKDIARQLVEDLPGKNITVILGGGRRSMGVSFPSDGGDSCKRNDSMNLVKTWQVDKAKRNLTTKYVTTTDQLRNIDVNNVDHILGMFAGSHLPYEYERNTTGSGTPSIKEMTEVALKRLKKNPKGFFLLVEGGRIDHALHDTRTHTTMTEVMAFEEAVEAALKMTSDQDTLVIVTADHSHVMTINGYPDRGNDILGTTTYDEVTDGLPFTTLMFTAGNATNFTYTENKVMRANLTGVDTTDHHFLSQAAVPVKQGSEMHGGEDVAVFAKGPMAHLFHRVHDQTFVAHVMAYASCVGPFKDQCGKGAPPEPLDPQSTNRQSRPTAKPSTEVENAAVNLCFSPILFLFYITFVFSIYA